MDYNAVSLGKVYDTTVVSYQYYCQDFLTVNVLQLTVVNNLLYITLATKLKECLIIIHFF